jgi:hypothetical protein
MGIGIGLGAIDYGQPVNRQAALNRGLVGWWLNLPLRRGANRLWDLCGRNDGLLTNGTLWGGTRGRPGGFGAIIHDGTDDLVDLGAPAAFKIAVYTVSCWAMRTGAGVGIAAASGYTNVVPIFTRGMGEGDNTSKDINWFVGANAASSYNLIATHELNTGADSVALSTTAMALNTWYHLVYTVNTNATLYANGVQIAQVAAQQPVATFNQKACLGASFNDAGTRQGAFAGLIDDARLYNRELSATEAYGLYLESATGYPTCLSRCPVRSNAHAVNRRRRVMIASA